MKAESGRFRRAAPHGTGEPARGFGSTTHHADGSRYGGLARPSADPVQAKAYADAHSTLRNAGFRETEVGQALADLRAHESGTSYVVFGKTGTVPWSSRPWPEAPADSRCMASPKTMNQGCR